DSAGTPPRRSRPECATGRRMTGWPYHTQEQPGLPGGSADADGGVMTDAMIIGGGSGIGLALARTLLTEGMNVTIVGRTAPRLAAARRRLAHVAGPDRIRTMAADVAREDDVAALFASTEQVDHIAVTAADPLACTDR